MPLSEKLVRSLPQTLPALLAGKPYEIGWDGVPLATLPFLAFDTETDIVDLSREVPRMALCTVSNGRRTVIVEPERMAEFILAHKAAKWVGFNVAFDWHVVNECLLHSGKAGIEAVGEWADLLDESRLHDAMILDFLVRLADPKKVVMGMNDLGKVGSEWLDTPLDKHDPYRMRFGELIGTDWAKADPGFWLYAVKDVIVTHALVPRLWEAAGEAQRNAAGPPCPVPPRWQQWGRLTEQLQVKASIVLAEAGRTGMAVVREEIDEAISHLDLTIKQRVHDLQNIDMRLFDYYKAASRATGAKKGDIKRNKNTGIPMMRMSELRRHLSEVAKEAEVEERDLPRTAKRGDLGTGLDAWREIAPDHPLVVAWADMADAAKTRQFLLKLDGNAVHPQYRVLVRTGRTSCREPNIQNMPREPWFRGLFTSRPGTTLAIVDYSFIELRTLAAECLHRYGTSRLADTIKEGRDPHVYTASMIEGMGYDEYLDLKKADEKRFKQGRQAAKAVNFGVPGGLGAAKLAMYAKANYGVDMGANKAKEMRRRLVQEVYPELSQYLSDSIVPRLARNLGCTPGKLIACLGMGDTEEDAPLWHGVSRVIDGHKENSNGRPYSADWKKRVWEGLEDACEVPGLRDLLSCHGLAGSGSLRRQLFGETAVTVTGRVRAGLTYCEARNTPFQGLAADGAKEALWRLWRAGYRIVGFIHDEIVCEVPVDGADSALKDIERIMCEAMESVWDCDLPCAVEGHLSERWSK